MPKVSIIIPIYNVEQYLRECLDSVVKQTLQDIEIICVNDGSTDSSLQIINEYAQKDNRIKIIDKPNSGYGDSMNKGLDMATGEYIGIVEPDDFVAKDMYEVLYAKAKEFDVDFVKADFYRFKTIPKVQNSLYKIFKEIDLYEHVLTPLDKVKVFSCCPSIWAAIYKRTFLEDKNIVFLNSPGASFQDTGFWIKVLLDSKRAFFFQYAGYHYRIDNANSSVKDDNKVFCICDEMHNLENRYFDKKQKIILNSLKIDKYTWNYNRLSNNAQKKFRKIFIKEILPVLKENSYTKEIVTPYMLETSNKIINSSILNKIFLLIKNIKNSITSLTILGVKIKWKNK